MGTLYTIGKGIIGRFPHYFGAFIFINVFLFMGLLLLGIYSDCQHGYCNWVVFWLFISLFQGLVILAGESNYQSETKKIESEVMWWAKTIALIVLVGLGIAGLVVAVL